LNAAKAFILAPRRRLVQCNVPPGDDGAKIFWRAQKYFGTFGMTGAVLGLLWRHHEPTTKRQRLYGISTGRTRQRLMPRSFYHEATIKARLKTGGFRSVSRRAICSSKRCCQLFDQIRHRANKIQLHNRTARLGDITGRRQHGIGGPWHFA
jgi:hypothetical protein